MLLIQKVNEAKTPTLTVTLPYQTPTLKSEFSNVVASTHTHTHTHTNPCTHTHTHTDSE